MIKKLDALHLKDKITFIAYTTLPSDKIIIAYNSLQRAQLVVSFNSGSQWILV